MIAKECDKYILCCDACDENELFNTFQEALNFKKREGWKSDNTDDEWVDICQECVERGF